MAREDKIKYTNYKTITVRLKQAPNMLPLLGTYPAKAATWTKEDLTSKYDLMFYRYPDGTIRIPEGWFRGLIRDNAQFVGLPKALCNHVRIKEDPEIKFKSISVIERNAVVRGNQGIKTRCEALNQWETIVTFEIPTSVVSEEQFIEILKHGRLGGSRHAGFGKFLVEQIKEKPI
jgi:hypothetical protein